MGAPIEPACGSPSASSSPPPNRESAPAPERARIATPTGRPLDRIGYEPDGLEAIRRAIHAPDGLVLVVGPPGSGRRTALHAMLEELGARGRRIRTVEATVRRRQGSGRHWEHSLERAVRDGGAILLERIATAVVAQLALQAAQAGHLILSTMSLARAASVLAELQRLRVSARQTIDGLSLVISQRLVARLCPACSIGDARDEVRDALAPLANTWLAGKPVHARRAGPSGCSACAHTGYQGRLLAYEMIEVDSRARGLIVSDIDSVELERALLADGRTIWDHGLKSVAEGTTSLDALQAAVRAPR